MENEKIKNPKSTKNDKMKKIILASLFIMLLAQPALAAINPYAGTVPSILDTNNEKTKMVREGGATMRGDNQKQYDMPELFDKEKVVFKPKQRSIKQQVWEDYSYPTPRFVTD